MKPKILWLNLLFMGLTIFAQDPTARFYNGDLYHDIPVRGGKYDLFIDFCAFARALGRPCQVEGDEYRVVINNRSLVLNPAKKRVRVFNKQVQVRMMLVEGTHYMSVRSLIQVFQPLLSRQLIYEPTSRVLHLAKEKTMSVAMASGNDKDSYYLQLRFDKFGKKPSVQRSGRYLVISFKSPFLRLDSSNMVRSEAIVNYNLFDHLPDKSSEIHLELGPTVSNFKVEPISSESGFLIIRFFGEFSMQALESQVEGASEGMGGIRRILLDPGHGGKDEGARGPSGLKEKHVTLLLCRALARSLERLGYEVILSREGDYHLPLKVRTGIANNENVDLLISLHLNAIPVANAWGSETYYLSPDDSFSEEESYTVMFENQDLHPEGEEEESEAPSTDIDLDLILWDLAQTEFLDDSFRVSKYVQEELNILAGTKNRGVKQAPLKVLQGARMPACLVEVAFISNPREEQKLRDPAFKSSVVRALSKAIVRYDQDVQRRNQGKNSVEEAP